jgi:uncharacterized protein (TIGR02646 family)
MVHTPRHAPPPAQLVKHGKRWTARFQSGRGEWATRQAKQVLGVALRALAHGKCVYCESALEVTAYLAIDHYVAKTVAEELSFEWTNLLPACQICNTAKGQQDHKGVLLKPDVDDPEPYFWIHPDTGRLEPHPTLDDKRARRASETIRLCNLQRAALCTNRVEMMKRVRRWLDLLASHPNAGVAEEWESLSSPVTQYKLVLRHVLELRGLRALAQFDRQRFTRTPASPAR